MSPFPGVAGSGQYRYRGSSTLLRGWSIAFNMAVSSFAQLPRAFLRSSWPRWIVLAARNLLESNDPRNIGGAIACVRMRERGYTGRFTDTTTRETSIAWQPRLTFLHKATILRSRTNILGARHYRLSWSIYLSRNILVLDIR